MQVNTEIWGNSSTWRNFTMRSSGMTVTVKIPSSANRDYVRTYTTGNNRLPLSIGDDIDQSPALWGIGKDALLHKQFLTYVTWNADDENNRFKVEMKSALDDNEIGKSKPLILFSCNKNDNASNEVFNPFSSNSMERYAPTITSLYERPYAFSPILNLNYKTIMLLPYIVCVANTNKYAQSGYSLYDINSFNTLYESEIANQKTVVGFVWRYFWGSDGNRAANQQSNYKSVGFACSYKYKAYISTSGSYTSEPTYDYKNIYGCDRFSYAPSEQCMINGIIANPLNSSISSFDIANANYGRENNGTFSRGAHTFWFDEDVMEFINNGNTSSPKTRAVFKSTLTKQEIIDYTKKQTAFIGFPFCDDINHISDFVGSNNIFYPVFSNGITTGEYVNGSAVFDSDNYKWSEDIREKADYDPTKPETPDEDDKGKLNNYTFHSFAARGSNKFYALDSTDVKNFIDFVNTLYVNDPDNKQLTLDFKGSNPNNYIVGLYKYPWNLVVLPTTTIKLGVLDTSINAYEADTGNGYFACGEVYVNKEFNNFRDFAPYTILELFIPYCGTVELDSAFFVGHSVGIDIVYDLNTAAMTAIVYRNDGNNKTIYKTVEGTAAASVPLTSVETGNYQNTITRLKLQKRDTVIRGATAGLQAVVSAMTGGAGINDVISAAQSGYDYGSQIRDINYELSHIQPSLADTSTASPSNGFTMSDTPILFIKRLKTLEGYDPATYSHTVGNACCINAERLGDFSGLVKCSNVDLTGIPATADEINAIKSALQDGVYL